MEISVDKQTILLTEINSLDNKSLVMIFDIYSLDMIFENEVDTVNPSNKEHVRTYNKLEDLEQPDKGDYWPTSTDFPRFTSFGFGDYLLVGVGDAPESKKISEFRIYDTKLRIMKSTFNRLSHPQLKGVMVSYHCHPSEEETFYFIMKESSKYTINEVNLIHNSWDRICSYSGGETKMIRISDDISQVFLVNKPDDVKDFYLYSVPFGKSINFERDNISYDGKLGSIVHSMKTSHGWAIVVYEDETTIKVGLLRDGNYSFFIDEFGKLDDTEEYALLSHNEVIMLNKMSEDSFECIVSNKKNTSLDSSTYQVHEFTGYKYDYPDLWFLKGGNEVFKYNISTNKFTYCKLNSGFVALQNESYEKLSYSGLIDRGDSFVKAEFYLEDGTHSDFKLIGHNRNILKEYLPKSRLIGCFPDGKTIYTK